MQPSAPVRPAPNAPWRQMPWQSPPCPGNMLVPQAYDVAWTVITQAFNEENSPGEIASAAAALAGVTTTTSTTTTETTGAEISNFPTGPNTPGDRPYLNPITCTVTPLTAGSSGQVLAANPRRTLFILQNNSASGGATFWLAFGQPATANQSLSLAPGQSITLDAACPRDSVNLLVTGVAGLTAGAVVEASYSPGS